MKLTLLHTRAAKQHVCEACSARPPPRWPSRAEGCLKAVSRQSRAEGCLEGCLKAVSRQAVLRLSQGCLALKAVLRLSEGCINAV